MNAAGGTPARMGMHVPTLMSRSVSYIRLYTISACACEFQTDMNVRSRTNKSCSVALPSPGDPLSPNLPFTAITTCRTFSAPSGDGLRSRAPHRMRSRAYAVMALRTTVLITGLVAQGPSHAPLRPSARSFDLNYSPNFIMSALLLVAYPPADGT
jgi:hypothetical protein